MGEQSFTKLRVFLSWSGGRSKAVAQVFRDWLPSVLQNVQPYFTPDDIEKGARWSGEIRSQLEATDFGVIFLTPENVNAPWILFEAGALSKLDKSRVAPLLLGMEPAEVAGPLGQLQLTRFSREDCFKLIVAINRSLAEMGLEPPVLETVFTRAWTELEQKVEAAMASEPTQHIEKRTDRDMLEEVLERVRALESRGASRPPTASLSLPVIKKWSIGWDKVASETLRDPDQIPVKGLPISDRARNSLEAAGLVYVGDLLKLSEADLLMLPNFGATSVAEVVNLLSMLGYDLRSD